MVRGTELTAEVRAQVMVLHGQNYLQRRIAEILNISRSSVSRTITKAKQLGSFESRRRSGRPRISSATTDRKIRRAAVAHPTWSSVTIAASTSSGVSPRTIRRRLHKDFGLSSYKPARKARLSPKNIKDRLAFCRKYEKWTPDMWKTVMFSDESTFSQFHSYVRNVQRPRNQRYNMRYVVPTVKQAPTTVVWASFCGSGRGGLWFMPKNTTINGTVYLNILKDKLPTHMGIQNCKIFQHDGSPCHRTAAVSRWLEEEGIEVLGPWPGSSPDLNPIENLWTHMKKKVAERNPTSEASLKEAIRTVWTTEITPQYCQALVSSMPKRIKDVLANKGGYIKY